MYSLRKLYIRIGRFGVEVDWMQLLATIVLLESTRDTTIALGLILIWVGTMVLTSCDAYASGYKDGRRAERGNLRANVNAYMLVQDVLKKFRQD